MKLISKLKHFFKEYQWPILSGALIGTSFIPFPPWAALFGLIPLWHYWQSAKSLKQILLSGWVAQFVFTSIGFSWIAYNIHEFGQMPWSLSILGMIIFCSFANYYIPVSGGIWWLIIKKFPNRKNFWILLLLGSITALGDNYLQTIFKWNFGYTFMWSKIPIYQWAEFIGFSGVSSLVILINALVFWCLLHWQKSSAKFLMTAIGFFLLTAILIGQQLPERWKNNDAILRPLVVQANIANQQKIFAEKQWGFRSFIVDKFINLTNDHLTKDLVEPTFVVWPETAFPDYLNVGSTLQTRKLQRFLKDKNLNLVTGGYSKDIKNDRSANSLFFIDSQGEVYPEFYRKSILLAFGEYIPGAETFPFLKKLLPMIADFKRGPGPWVQEFAGIRLGPQICYESLYPHFTRGLVEKGAEVIVNVTNDSWFGWWQEPYQHLYMTLARGIEFRRPVIRSTNTGITTAMLATGETLEQSPIGTEWATTFTLPYKINPAKTFYARYFHLVPALLILLSLILTYLIRFRGVDE